MQPTEKGPGPGSTPGSAPRLTFPPRLEHPRLEAAPKRAQRLPLGKPGRKGGVCELHLHHCPLEHARGYELAQAVGGSVQGRVSRARSEPRTRIASRRIAAAA